MTAPPTVEAMSSSIPSKPHSQQRLRLVFDARHAWPKEKKHLSFWFFGGKETQHKIVFDAIKEIELHTGLRILSAQEAKDADIRISFLRGGFESCLGTEAQTVHVAKATMNLSLEAHYASERAEAEAKGHVLHEFLHALSFLHEHNSPGSPLRWNVVKTIQHFMSKYGMTVGEVWDNILTTPSAEHTRCTEYDPSSIMHYPIEDRGLTEAGVLIARNHALSELDKKGLQLFFSQEHTENKAPA